MTAVKRPAAHRIPVPAGAGLLVLAAAAGLIAWPVVTRRDAAQEVSRAAPAATPATTTAAATAPPTSPRAIAPVVLPAARLETVVASLRQPVYWLGALPGAEYELTRATTGAITIRYLPPGARAGDPRAFPTVGTYPFPGAYAVAQVAIHGTRNRWMRVPGGGIASYLLNDPASIYVAFPGVDDRIQVYHPSPDVARRLVAAGALQRLG